MRANWKPILAVMALAPLLTELLSGNIPLTGFLNPFTLLFLLTLGYGLPVLLLREFAVARKMGILGMLPLGLCYGIINEGLLAKTFFMPRGVPNPSFTQYGYFGGVEAPWALQITTWHALFAFLFPILIVESAMPEFRGKQWFTRRQSKIIAVLVAVLGTFIFFNHNEASSPNNPAHFGEMVIIFAMLLLASTEMPKTPVLETDHKFRISKFFVGAGVLVGILLVPSAFAGAKLPVFLFFTYYAIAFYLAYRFLSSRREISRTSSLLFAFGAIGLQALFGVGLGTFTRQPLLALTSFVFVLVLVVSTFKLKYPPAPSWPVEG